MFTGKCGDSDGRQRTSFTRREWLGGMAACAPAVPASSGSSNAPAAAGGATAAPAAGDPARSATLSMWGNHPEWKPALVDFITPATPLRAGRHYAGV
jgi:hypothetical protein